MNPLFLVGMCISIHGYSYTIKEAKDTFYLLEQQVTVFEEEKIFQQYWKTEYVNKEAKQRNKIDICK